MNEKIKILEERISAEEYIDFLKRTDLGSQYPKERFENRIAKLVNTVSISIIARNESGTVVGVLFGLTDFAYWLYVTDLGVDRAYTGQAQKIALTSVGAFFLPLPFNSRQKQKIFNTSANSSIEMGLFS